MPLLPDWSLLWPFLALISGLLWLLFFSFLLHFKFQLFYHDVYVDNNVSFMVPVFCLLQAFTPTWLNFVVTYVTVDILRLGSLFVNWQNQWQNFKDKELFLIKLYLDWQITKYTRIRWTIQQSSNIVNFYKTNATAEVYRYTHTLCSVHIRKLVRCNNSVDFSIILNILLNPR